MPSPYEAPCLGRLKTAMDQRWPDRDRRTDGWIGDAAHQARTSDHNPDKKTGVVRARDIDKDGIHIPTVLAAVMAHPSTNYVIYNKRIWRYADRFYPRAYDGDNPHTDHLHVSIKHDRVMETNVKLWLPIPGISWRSELRFGMTGDEVKQLQGYLNGHWGTVTVDGFFGAKTVAAVKLFQKRQKLQVDGLVGPKTRKALATA